MTQKNLNTIANVFGVCFLLCVSLQLLALGMYLGLHDWAFGVHSSLFPLTEEQFGIAVYYLLTMMKTLGLTLFLAPWAALKLVARSVSD